MSIRPRSRSTRTTLHAAPDAGDTTRRVLDPFDLPPIPHRLFFTDLRGAGFTRPWLADYDNRALYLQDDLSPQDARRAWIDAFADYVLHSEARPQLAAVGGER